MRKLLLLTIAFFFAFSVSAQIIGVKTGFTKSGYKINFETPDGANMGEGFHLGVFAERPIKENMNLRLSLTYNQLGSEKYLEGEQSLSNGMTFSGTTDMKNEFNYIQLSLTPKFKLGNAAYAFIGPYLGYAVSATYSGTITTDDGTVLMEADGIDLFGDVAEKGMDDYYNKFDFGGNLGLGMNLKNGFFAELSLGMGFLNVINTDSALYSMAAQKDPDTGEPMTEDLSQRNMFIGFSIGHIFKIKK